MWQLNEIRVSAYNETSRIMSLSDGGSTPYIITIPLVSREDLYVLIAERALHMQLLGRTS
jgi:hypothetical protein